MRSRLVERFPGLDIPYSIVYDQPTMFSLTSFVKRQLGDQDLLDFSNKPPQSEHNVEFSMTWVESIGRSFTYGQVPWDSDSLGLPIFSVRCHESIDIAELGAWLQDLQTNHDSALVFARAPVDDLSLSIKLASQRFYTVETAMVPFRSLSNLDDLPPLPVLEHLEIRLAREEEKDDILSLVEPIFRDGPGRYHLDPNVDKLRAHGRYRR